MKKERRALPKPRSHRQLSTSTMSPRRERGSILQRGSQLQDESLPSDRSFEIHKSMVHYLDSMAATPEHKRPQHLLDENTDVSSLTMPFGWTQYLDKTYHLRSAKKSSQTTVHDDSSLMIEHSRTLEEATRSPERGSHFYNLRKRVVPKAVRTEIFEGVFISPKKKKSNLLPAQPKRITDLTVENVEVNSPVLRQSLRRRKNAKTDPALFQDAFKDSPRITHSSGHSVLNDQNSGDARHDDSSLRAENNRRLEDVAKSPEGHPRFELRRKSLKDADTSVFEAVFTSPKVKNSDLLSTQPKKVTDLSAEDVESSSPIFSQPFKRKKHAKTDPALFQDVFQDSTRNTRPSGVLTAPKSGDTGHDSSLTTENSRSLEVVAKSPETHPRFERQHKNVKDAHTSVFESVFISPKTKKSDLLSAQSKGVTDLPAEDFDSSSPTFSQTFKRRRRAKTDPAVFQDVFQDSTRNKRSTRVLNAPNSEDATHDDGTLGTEHSRSLEVTKPSESHPRLEQQRKSMKDSDTAVFEAVFTSPKAKNSDSQSAQPKRVTDLSAEDVENSQPFKRRKNSKTFQDVFQDSIGVMNDPNSEDARHDSSLRTGPSRSLEDVTKPLEDHPRFERRRKSVKDADTAVFEAVSASPKAKKSDSLSIQTKRVTKLDVEDVESTSLAVSQPKRRHARTDPAVFQDVFQDSSRNTRSSIHSVLNDPNSETSVHNDSSLMIQHSRTLGEAARSPESRTPFQRQRKKVAPQAVGSEVFEAVFTSPKAKNSDLKSAQPHTDLPAEDVESSSPAFSQPFKKRKHAKTDPAVFQDVFQDSTRNTRSSSLLNDRNSGDARHDASSLRTEHSRKLEDVAKSPEGHPHFEHQRKSMKDADTSAFEAVITSPKAKKSDLQSVQPIRVADLSAEDVENFNPTVSRSFTKRKHAKTDPALFQDAFKDSTRITHSSRHSVLNDPNSVDAGHDDSPLTTEHRSLEDVEISPESHPIFEHRHKNVKDASVFESTTPHSTQMEENKMHKSVKHKQSTSNKSVKPQNVPWFHQWQLKAAATRNLNNFALLPREERSTKLEAIVREVKKKHDEALKSRLMLETVSREPEVPRTLKVTPAITKKPVPRKPLHPDLLVNGKPYKPRRLKRPKPWATPRLYKFIIQKCEEKYGMLRARRKAEEFVVFLCEKVSTVIRRKNYENYKSILEEIKRALYKLGVIKCLMDYFVFIEDYLPHLYRIKAIPCVGAHGKHTGPPWVPGTNLVADLGY